MYKQEWIYDTETKKRKALHKAGFTLFSDLTNYEWHRKEENPRFVSLRFTLPEQATSYAYLKLMRGQLN